jgi:hypothetical protein
LGSDNRQFYAAAFEGLLLFMVNASTKTQVNFRQNTPCVPRRMINEILIKHGVPVSDQTAIEHRLTVSHFETIPQIHMLEATS